MSSPIILPDIAVLDADLTLGLPPGITAATGVDAMVHAIEAYASKNPNNNPLSKMLARQALQLLGANIEKAVFEGGTVRRAAQCCSVRCWRGRLSPILLSRPSMHWPIRSAERSMFRMAFRTLSCCRMSYASTHRMPRPTTPKSPRTPSRTWPLNKGPGPQRGLCRAARRTLCEARIAVQASRCGHWTRASAWDGSRRHEADKAARKQSA